MVIVLPTHTFSPEQEVNFVFGKRTERARVRLEPNVCWFVRRKVKSGLARRFKFRPLLPGGAKPVCGWEFHLLKVQCRARRTTAMPASRAHLG
jgi:hypothetical protein